MLVAVVFVIYSAAIAVVTSDKCDDARAQEWQFVPPAWNCLHGGP